VESYISLHHTRIQDIHTLLTELELNSQFGDITAFATYGYSGKSTESPKATSPSTERVTETSYRPLLPISVPLSTEPQPPGLFLIHLAVLAAATRLRIDPWNDTTGYIQFITLHHWHPSFGIGFLDFLQLVHTELQEGRLHQDQSNNPFDLLVGPPSEQPNSPFEDPS
jgi:hypothetical protein